MPGPVSDAYDPEWGTRENARLILDALENMYDRLSGVLGHQEPVYIGDLVTQEHERSQAFSAVLTEWEWRIIRFALERAQDSI